jgi:ABC-type multidrug transport system fused ATPase/permease subunit
MRDLRRLLRYLLPHTGTFVIATCAMIVVALLETATSALIVPIFDRVCARQRAPCHAIRFAIIRPPRRRGG